MPETPPAPLDSRSQELAEAMSESKRREIEDHHNVEGTGFGPKVVGGTRTDEVAFIIHVQEKIANQDLPPGERLPTSVHIKKLDETVETDVREVGRWSADTGSPTRGERVRPVVGGVEVGASEGAATTTGLFETRDGERRLLTARHIIRSGEAALGRNVRQPADGDIIGEVRGSHEFIVDSGTRRNLLDTALVEPENEDIATGQYLGWHDAAGTGRPSVGDRVTAITSGGGIAGGTVVARDVSATVTLQNGDVARYGGLVEYDWGGASRASGAAVGRIDPDSRELIIVGQHVASASSASLMTPWTTIERQFGYLHPVSEFYERVPGGYVGGGTDQPSTVTIRVEDSSGNPIQGATVTVDPLDSVTSSATIQVVDESGNPIQGASVTIEQT